MGSGSSSHHPKGEQGKHVASATWAELRQRGSQLTNTFKLLLIADQDKDSGIDTDGDGVADVFVSTVIQCTLQRCGTTTKPKFKLEVADQFDVRTSISDMASRGAELSSLCVHEGKLLTCDDRTGWVYELIRQPDMDGYQLKEHARCIDADGQDPEKGFKCEWMVSKDGKLVVGSHGRKETYPGAREDRLRWVKVIDGDRVVEHVDWKANYAKVAASLHIDPEKGYVTHEAALWSEVHNLWFFFPRRVSTQPWSVKGDAHSSSNILVAVSEDNTTGLGGFGKVHTREVLKRIPTRGCADLTFVPNSGESEIVCVRTYEVKDRMESYVSVFDLGGQVLLRETRVLSGLKLEGIVCLGSEDRLV
eukprot:m.12887 g.12887  ORF g.12887 m.12887 type:complete len:362 (+) comp4388_c0_seq2:315-1400(+)